MMKDTFFSGSRFWKLCRKDITENWKTNLLRMALLYGVMAILFLWGGYINYQYTYSETFSTTHGDPVWILIYASFGWFLLVFGCLSASLIMERMKNKTGRISVLMTPATPFEKFFSRWLIVTVLFLVAFFVIFELVDFTRVGVYWLIFPESRDVILPVSIWEVDRWQDAEMRPFLVSFYFFVQSLFVLGGTIWPKGSWLKTFVAVTVIVIIYIAVFVFLTKIMGDYGYGWRIKHALGSDGDNAIMVVSAFLFFFAIVNWALAYFRFKESEIIHHM